VDKKLGKVAPSGVFDIASRLCPMSHDETEIFRAVVVNHLVLRFA